ncbi:FecR family protein [Butyricimonas synergistica]|uniref:FecR family protein n=1 Tax=Butyricimonas synergistica TaxID=544644 RepID=UPI000374DFCD|nr:FecR family protein [Butyricimonas synergistica]
MGNKQISTRLIYRKIEGNLSPGEERIFDEWLNEDVTHRRYYEDMREEFSREDRLSLSEREVQKAWSTFDFWMQKQKKTARKRNVVWGTGIAASIIVVLCCCLFLYMTRRVDREVLPAAHAIVPGQNNAVLEMADGSVYYLGEKNFSIREKTGRRVVADSAKLSYVSASGEEQVTEEIVYNRLRVPRGGEYKIELEDGTRIWLNSASLLQYPVSFAKDKREVYLEGEAYFEVKRDTARPFVVHAGAQEISVLGTSFGVTCYEGTTDDYTTLVSGKVKVKFERVDKSCVLQPGMQVAYNKASGVVTERNVDVSEYVAWKDGIYVFKQKRLEDILTTLSRWYDFQVFYRNEDVKDVMFSGEVKRFGDFSYLLRLIERTSDVKFIIDKKVVQVMR